MRTSAVLALAALMLKASWCIAVTQQMPKMMLAAAIDRGGGPEVLSIHRVPVPKANAGEVLIAVQAAGVGVWEAGMRQHPGNEAQFPLILGSDGAGTVAAIGPGVQGFKVGDRVYGSSDAFYAEYAAVRSGNAAHIPKSINFKALPV